MSFFVPLHPRFVHFPVALLLVGSVLAVVYLLRGPRPGWSALIWSLIGLGWVAVFLAILTGLVDRNAAAPDPAVTAVMNPHTALGFALLAVYGWLLYERLRAPALLDQPRRRALILTLFVLGGALVLAEGWLGGKLVFELGVGVRLP